MFSFDEVENKQIKDLENRLWEMDNIAKHWKSMYEKEVKLRPIKVRYVSDNQIYRRTQALLHMVLANKTSKTTTRLRC